MKSDLFQHVCSHVVIGVVREDDEHDAWQVAVAMLANGVATIEITLTTPGAFGLITRLRSEYPDLVVAAGSVRTSNDAALARRAGATIIVSPHTDRVLIEYAIEHGLLPIAGAATATEIISAWNAGAGIVKIFPAPQLGGPDFFRAIRGPIRDVPLLAGGPVGINMMESYLDAGAVAVNLGAALAVPELVAMKKWEEIGKRAGHAIGLIRQRKGLGSERSGVVH